MNERRSDRALLDFNPFTDRIPIDFLEPVPTLADRFRLTAKYTIKALPAWILVVDLSHWNGDVDFEALRASGVQAVILKVSEGAEGTYYQFKDPRFEEFWRKAIDAGFPIMLYHFFRGEKGSAEKSWFMKCADSFLNDSRINGKTATWLDCEWKASTQLVTTYSNRAFGFCDLIKGEGMRQGAYCSPGLVSRLFPPNDVRWGNVYGWNAHWTSLPEYSLPSGWTVDMVVGWQFGIYDDHWWAPEVRGAGDVDVNKFFFASEDALRQWMGQTLEPPPPPPPNGHEHPELQELINLALYNNAENKQAIEELKVLIDDLEARDAALTADIIDINRRLQAASNDLGS